MNLSALLEIIRNPENPAFRQAVEQLAHLIPKELPREEIPALLAQLDETISTLTKAKDATSAQLEKLRAQASAMQSYGTSK